MNVLAKPNGGERTRSIADTPIRILYLEDDELAYRLLEQVALKETGLQCQFTWAKSIDEAQQCLRRASFDLCMIDYHLAGEDGFDFISSLPLGRAEFPCILLTGANDTETGDRALEHGFSDYLVKDRLDGPQLRRTVLYALERQQIEIKLRNLAFHDPLTNLYDRTAFAEHLDQQLRMRRRNGRNFGMIYVDLDRFKAINDTSGHHVGDCVLIAIARRLETELRESDIIARLGGDEFAVCCPDVPNYDELSGIADKLIAALSRPVDVEGHCYPIRCSIGIALSDDSMRSVDDFVRASDHAMYEAKRAGGNRVAMYSRDMSQRLDRRIRVEAALARALAECRLGLAYQPIANLSNGRFVSLEALARLTDDELGAVTPAEFIPIAEASGLIDDLSSAVFSQACRSFARMQALPAFAGARLALNLSPRQMVDPELAPTLARMVDDAGLSRAAIEVEVTEAFFAGNEDLAIEQAHKLRRVGARISIDDFGTGYSSLSRLQRYPIDAFKIDGSFVSAIEANEAGSRLCGAIIDLGRALNIEVVSEGVETARQLAALRATGCNYAQGYIIGRPASADDILNGAAPWATVH